MLHCPFLLPRSCSRRFPGGTRSVSTIVAAASMSSLRNATLAMGANRRLSPVSYSSCVSLHLNDEIMRIVYYAPHNMSMGRTRNLKSDARAVNNTQTGLLQRFRVGSPTAFSSYTMVPWGSPLISKHLLFGRHLDYCIAKKKLFVFLCNVLTKSVYSPFFSKMPYSPRIHKKSDRCHW